MKEQQTMMIEQQASLRNHQPSIHNLEVQIGQLTTLVSNKLSSQFHENNSQPHVMMIETKEKAISKFLKALEVEPKQSDPKLENKNVAKTQKSRCEPLQFMLCDQSDRKTLENISTYCPPLPFPSRANLSPLEWEHLEFIKYIKNIPINTPFVETFAKIPEYATFLQDLMDSRQQLKKNSKVVEQSSRLVLGELPKKIGDPGRLTLPCEFGNNLKTYASADSGASINLMPFSFYKMLNIQKMKATKMTIHIENRSVTQPRGIVEYILVKIGNFVFPINYVIMDMKEDLDVPIILGRPLLNTTGALVDICESKITLRIGDEKETFGIEDGFQGSDVQGEVFNIDKEDELEELGKLIEEEIKTI
ncbi:uncharacterized protein LOC111895867 [Lactuca sativa]|uniref:uncharacterized protein LOC111895867 n=1 Tax=Lactuca sativa TaxID=4236 RepID=UPI000CD97DD6|nr:uncharacterized protein LOC111895867 [Lactuca sativa]